MEYPAGFIPHVIAFKAGQVQTSVHLVAMIPSRGWVLGSVWEYLHKRLSVYV